MAEMKSDRPPPYTAVGFAKFRTSELLHQRLLSFYRLHKHLAIRERWNHDVIDNVARDQVGSLLVDLPEALRVSVAIMLRPPLEAWCGRKLIVTAVYGIRVYCGGATLELHRDWQDTHVFGVIINIDQVAEPWPLVIEDQLDRDHEVFLEPGEMLFYEAARLQHGRPQPLMGQSYVNAFAHFMPLDPLAEVS